MLEDIILKQVAMCDRITQYNSNNLINIIGTASYLREFRTVGLLVPRRSGKTCTLQNMSKRYSSLLFKKYRDDGRDRTLEDYNYETMYIGRVNSGPKYRFVLLDEYKEVPEKAYRMCEYLMRNSYMESDPIIITLSTP